MHAPEDRTGTRSGLHPQRVRGFEYSFNREVPQEQLQRHPEYLDSMPAEYRGTFPPGWQKSTHHFPSATSLGRVQRQQISAQI
jgi:hypothetical protein